MQEEVETKKKNKKKMKGFEQQFYHQFINVKKHQTAINIADYVLAMMNLPASDLTQPS